MSAGRATRPKVRQAERLVGICLGQSSRPPPISLNAVLHAAICSSGRSLRRKKSVPLHSFAKTLCVAHVQPWLVVIGDWQLAVGGWGGWGNWWWLAAVGGWWGLGVGGWQLVAVGSGWWLAVGGWRQLVVGSWCWALWAVLSKKKKIGFLKDCPAAAITVFISREPIPADGVSG